MSDADSIVVQPSGGVRGSLHVAGDKSISHRAAMLSSLSSGVSQLCYSLHACSVPFVDSKYGHVKVVLCATPQSKTSQPLSWFAPQVPLRKS